VLIKKKNKIMASMSLPKEKQEKSFWGGSYFIMGQRKKDIVESNKSIFTKEEVK